MVAKITPGEQLIAESAAHFQELQKIEGRMRTNKFDYYVFFSAI